MYAGGRALAFGAFLLFSLGSAWSPLDVNAQQASPQERLGPRRATLSGGFGNHYGGIGGQIEVHALKERASILGAAGYAPGSIQSGGLTGAVAIRGYLPGLRHRFYGSLGIAPLESYQEWTMESVDLGITRWTVSDPEFHYGPTVSAGYQYSARRGFTAQLGAGVGYYEKGSFFVLDVGAGYTFGR